MRATWLPAATVFTLLWTLTHADEALQRKGASFPLPVINIQFVCPQDIRPTFNYTEVFGDFYGEYVPEIDDTQFEATLKMSGIGDIPQGLPFYSRCNLTSPRVLVTMRVEGWAQEEPGGMQHVNSESDFEHYVMKNLTRHNIERYFNETVCPDMERFETSVTSPIIARQRGAESYTHILVRLCPSDEDNYQDEVSDSFKYTAVLMGVAMVAWVLMEVQKFCKWRSCCIRSAGDDAQEYEAPPNEIELT